MYMKRAKLRSCIQLVQANIFMQSQSLSYLKPDVDKTQCAVRKVIVGVTSNRHSSKKALLASIDGSVAEHTKTVLSMAAFAGCSGCLGSGSRAVMCRVKQPVCKKAYAQVAQKVLAQAGPTSRALQAAEAAAMVSEVAISTAL